MGRNGVSVAVLVALAALISVFLVGLATDAQPSYADQPRFNPEYVAARICVDDPSGAPDRGAFFDGGELVGRFGATSGVGTALTSANATYSLVATEESPDYAFFAVDGNGTTTVSALGAGDTTGLAADRLYSFVVQVRETGTGLTARVTVTAQMVLTGSPNGDGRCP